MQWKSVVGHKAQQQYIKQLISRDQLPHALLIHADDGVGALPFALATIQHLFCENRTDEESCGDCHHCKQTEKLIHPDVHFTYPFPGGDKKTAVDFISFWRDFVSKNPYGTLPDWYAQLSMEQKQGNINRDECLRIMRNLSLKAYQGSYKVSLIWKAEFLGKEGNRLLKLLEEPQPNTHFILIASNLDQILTTIISRCQLIYLPPLSNEQIEEYLVDQGVANDQIGEAAYLANGKISEALRFQSFGEASHIKACISYLRVVFKGNGIEIKNWVDDFSKQGKETQKIQLTYIVYFLGELMRSIAIPEYPGKIPKNVRMSFDKLKTLFSLLQIEQLIQNITQILNHIERNVNIKIMMMHMSQKMHRIMKEN